MKFAPFKIENFLALQQSPASNCKGMTYVRTLHPDGGR